MNRSITALFAALFAALLVTTVAACGGDDDASDVFTTTADGSIQISIPDELTVPADGSIPASVQVTDAVIDAIVASLENSGATVDRDCVADAIRDADLTELTDQAQAYDAEFVQRFIACITP